LNREKIVEKFIEYIKIDSPSFEEKNFALVVKEDLEKLGFKVLFDNSKEKTGSNTGNLIGKLKGNPSLEPIMFSAHLDTVSPGINIEPVIKDGLIYSKGDTILASDDKSGIVAIIEGVRYILENKIDHGDIEVVLTTCEESGLLGSSNLDYELIDSKLAFVLDGGGDVGKVFNQGPAQSLLDINFHGKSAHAGLNPEDGINAIQVAARAINSMNLLRIDEETTANVGTIQGGRATNIVTDLVNVKIEARSLNEEKLRSQIDSLVDSINSATEAFKTKADIDIIPKYPVFSISRDHRIISLVTKALENIGLEAEILPTGGGSDTNIYNGKGIDSIILSTGMEDVHTTNEFIKIENLIKSTELVASIIKSL